MPGPLWFSPTMALFPTPGAEYNITRTVGFRLRCNIKANHCTKYAYACASPLQSTKRICQNIKSKPSSPRQSRSLNMGGWGANSSRKGPLFLSVSSSFSNLSSKGNPPKMLRSLGLAASSAREGHICKVSAVRRAGCLKYHVNKFFG